MFDEKLTVAAWKTKPTWAVISTKDQMLPGHGRIGRKENGRDNDDSFNCHMSILEAPAKITAVIDGAAKNALKTQ
jgi:hypothetical protein